MVIYIPINLGEREQARDELYTLGEYVLSIGFPLKWIPMNWQGRVPLGTSLSSPSLLWMLKVAHSMVTDEFDGGNTM